MNYPLIKTHRLTVDEFREMELNAPEEERWELIDGVIVRSMAGGTIRHNMIVQNVAGALQRALRSRGSRCRAYTESVRLDADGKDLSTLPDVVVSCDPPGGDKTTLYDATAVVEVHSTASRQRDKSEKLDAYMSLPGVRTIVLIEQVSMGVMTHTRSANGWLRLEFSSPDDRIAFDGLDVCMTLAEIYEDVEFDAA